jgi:ATP-dependent RNA helicase DeaD
VLIAAAAVKLAHAAEEGGEAEAEIPTVAPPERARYGDARPPRPGGASATHAPRHVPSRDRDPGAGNVVRLFIGAGREAGIRPGDLVGAITGEAGIASRDLGAIEIADRFSLIDVPESRAEEIIAALRATTLRGKRVSVRPDRGPSRT